MTLGRMNPRPPQWAEMVLRLFLAKSNRDCVSGDLLEEYREAIAPSRARTAANMWYVRQVAGVVLRTTWMWAVVFSGAFVVRQVYDGLVPTHDFAFRSEVTTYTAVAILAGTAFWAAWRSSSWIAGMIVTLVMTEVAAVLSVVGVTVFLAIWHDPVTMNAISRSGGLEEAYVLPFMAPIPAVIVGTVAAAVGSMSRRIVRVDAA
jgi:hypothetical protein